MQLIRTWRCRRYQLCFDDTPRIMGILNVTPDSFSDGGRFRNLTDAVAHGLEMVADGADIIDVGGESSRPGSEAVSVDEELRRVIPVIESLSDSATVPISIDTTKAEVARRAVAAGASIVNDISAGTKDPEILEIAAASGCGAVLMHMQGKPRSMQLNPRYRDVVGEVEAFLNVRVEEAIRIGIKADCIAIDPGIGFGKSLSHNIDLIRATGRLSDPGYPVVLGLSRKRFLGDITGKPVEQRLAGSIAAAVFSVLNGAAVLRVHDVSESYDAVKVAMALLSDGAAGE